MSQRRTTSNSVFAAGLVLLAGCGGGNSSAPSQSPPSAASASLTARVLAADDGLKLIDQQGSRLVYQTTGGQDRLLAVITVPSAGLQVGRILVLEILGSGSPVTCRLSSVDLSSLQPQAAQILSVQSPVSPTQEQLYCATSMTAVSADGSRLWFDWEAGSPAHSLQLAEFGASGTVTVTSLADGTKGWFSLTDGDTRVIFADSSERLLSVPSDGSAAPTVLSMDPIWDMMSPPAVVADGAGFLQAAAFTGGTCTETMLYMQAANSLTLYSGGGPAGGPCNPGVTFLLAGNEIDTAMNGPTPTGWTAGPALSLGSAVTITPQQVSLPLVPGGFDAPAGGGPFAAISADGAWLVNGTCSPLPGPYDVCLATAPFNGLTKTLHLKASLPATVAFTPDSQTALVLTPTAIPYPQNGPPQYLFSYQLWAIPVATGAAPVHVASNLPVGIVSMVVAADSHAIALLLQDNSVYLTDLRSPQETMQLLAPDGFQRSIYGVWP